MNEMRKLMEAVEESQEYVTKQVVGHEDRESHMMQRELLKIRDYAEQLVDMLDDLPDGDFPHWWQSKLVKAGDYMSTIKHFLEGEMELAARKQDSVDDMVSINGFSDEVVDDVDVLGMEDPYSIYEQYEDKNVGELTIKDLRKELREIGYKLKINSYSEFKAGDIISPEGHKINRSQWFGSKSEAEEWRKKHEQALKIKDKYKGKLFDGPIRVVL